jgi:PAS domain S-box-containing protein
MKIIMTSKGPKFVSPQIVYKKLLDNMNEAVWLGDSDEKTVYANKKFASMLGYKLEEMIGRESYDFWDKESAKRVKGVNDKDRKKGVSSSYEGNLLTKDGKLIPVLLSGSPFPGGGTVGIMTDLRELKKKEEQAAILNKSIEYSTEAIITFDKSLKIKTWNKGAKMVFGYSAKDALNSKITKIIPSKDISKYIGIKKTHGKFQISAKNKAKKNLIVNATLTHVPIGSSVVYLLIARDITKQIEFEQELTEKYKKMKEAYNKFGAMKKELDAAIVLLQTYKKSS